MEIFYRRVIGVFIVFLMMMSAASWAAEPEADAAGQVIVVSGPFQAINKDKQTRTLRRGDYFYSGEGLMTGTNSTAQVRFSDGTIMALNPNSQIKVDEYIYKKDPKKDKSTVNLIKGGFRALTGAISKASGAYKIETPVAVIGVRGTIFAGVLDEGKLYAGVTKGGIFVKNEKGEIDLGVDKDYSYAVVDSKDTAPVGLLIPPPQLVGKCGTHDNAPHTNF